MEKKDTTQQEIMRSSLEFLIKNMTIFSCLIHLFVVVTESKHKTFPFNEKQQPLKPAFFSSLSSRLVKVQETAFL